MLALIYLIGIPKTIDNDLSYLDRSFGFQSAVEAAQAAIHTAKVEARCNVPNGIGLVKLMGRSAGFLSAFASMGSGDVDLVLVPEVDIVLDGPNGVLPFLRQRIKEQKYAVVVVAEGAGEEILGQSAETDAGGNRKLPQIGEYMKKKIEEYFMKHGEEATVKYIDPSYTVRSVPANGADSLYCLSLAQNAVVSDRCLAILCTHMSARYTRQLQLNLLYLRILYCVAWCHGWVDRLFGWPSKPSGCLSSNSPVGCHEPSSNEA